MNIAKINTRIGPLKIISVDTTVLEIEFLEHLYSEDIPDESRYIVNEVLQYLSGELKEFTCTVKMKGTEFQKQVWSALLTIPYGETRSYKDIAEMINNPKAVRAVGGANNKNKIPIIIPCHRVIGTDGSLTGYAGGLDTKKMLLNIEKTH